MFCSDCGKETPEGSKFCVSCGAQQKEGAPTTVSKKSFLRSIIRVSLASIVGFFLLLFVILYFKTTNFSMPSLSESSSESSGSQNSESEFTLTDSVNHIVYKGITVSSVDFAIVNVQKMKTIDLGFNIQTASGTYIIVTFFVYNQQKDQISLNDSLFNIKDPSSGRIFSASSNANIGLKNYMGFENINPSLEKYYSLAFDVPQDLDFSNLLFQVQGGMMGDSTYLPLKVQKSKT